METAEANEWLDRNIAALLLFNKYQRDIPESTILVFFLVAARPGITLTELTRILGKEPGTIHKVTERLKTARESRHPNPFGWIEHFNVRPKKRPFRLTPEGIRLARHIIAILNGEDRPDSEYLLQLSERASDEPENAKSPHAPAEPRNTPEIEGGGHATANHPNELSKPDKVFPNAPMNPLARA